jgi:hypothetical protein
MPLSDTIRQQVRARAKNYCEYCLSHQDYIMGRLQIDHVQPVAKGGSDDIDNLCLACELCNQYKWTKTDAVDPETGETMKIFHPRHQTWSEHFAWNQDGTHIVGLTAVGRATAIALQLNNPLAVVVRRNWVKAGWHPPSVDPIV